MCAAAVANVLLMVPGRTGIIVLLVLFVYFLGRALKARGLVLAGVVLAALAVHRARVAGQHAAQANHARRRRVRAVARRRSARARRLRWGCASNSCENTLEIIGRNPGIGVGTGGFGKAYADRVGGTGAPATQNPHNEILLMIVQFGIAGFVLFAGLLVTQWRLAPRLPSRFETAAARAFVLTIAVTSLLSSTLLDHAEGFFLAYMSGLLFAGYRAGVPEVPGQRAR